MTLETLDALARSFCARVESCENFNPNVGEWARRRVRTRLRGYRVGAYLSDSKVAIEVKGLDTEVSFSVNDVDRVCLLDKPFVSPIAGLSCSVFVDFSNTEATATWLQQPENLSLVSDLRLGCGESLQVYRNAIVLIGQPKRATRDTVLSLCDLADRLRDRETIGLIDGLAFSVQNLPPGLQPLHHLVRRFATGDDVIRSELLDEASEAEREELRGRVKLLFPQINKFLDSFGDRPLSNEAILIGWLAEAVDELGSREA